MDIMTIRNRREKRSWKNYEKQGKMDIKTLRKRRKNVHGSTKANKEKGT